MSQATFGHPVEDRLLKIESVSEGLRKALEEGQWPGGRRRAKAIGPDGTEYYATSTARRDLVLIEALPYRPHSIAIPEPAGVVWKPMLTEEKPVKLEEVSESLRKALEGARWLDGHRYAVGIAPDGMPCRAFLRDDLVFIEEGWTVGWTDHRISEPEGVVWRRSLPDQEPVDLKEVGEGLRKALEEGRWPDGQCYAAGVGLDGTEYRASLRHDLVFMHEIIHCNSIDIPLPEPEGVVWKPILTENDWVKLDQVSEGLRRALEEGEWANGTRYAVGVGPDGMQYRAFVWHNDFVFIDFTDDPLFMRLRFHELKPYGRMRVPIPEPESVVWKPFFDPYKISPSQRRAWWRFWK
jgi:hypothetical protein